MRTAKRVQIIVGGDIDDIQNDINNFISENVKELIDVKLTETETQWTVLIIYI